MHDAAIYHLVLILHTIDNDGHISRQSAAVQLAVTQSGSGSGWDHAVSPGCSAAFSESPTAPVMTKGDPQDIFSNNLSADIIRSLLQQTILSELVQPAEVRVTGDEVVTTLYTLHTQHQYTNMLNNIVEALEVKDVQNVLCLVSASWPGAGRGGCCCWPVPVLCQKVRHNIYQIICGSEYFLDTFEYE